MRVCWVYPPEIESTEKRGVIMENKEQKERLINVRKTLIERLKTEYLDLCEKAERLHVFLHQSRLPDSEQYVEIKKTLPRNYYSYIEWMDEQLKDMNKYAEHLAYRIQEINDENERDMREDEWLQQKR